MRHRSTDSRYGNSWFVPGVVIIAAALLLGACQDRDQRTASTSADTGAQSETVRSADTTAVGRSAPLRIAEQHGLAYAPLALVQREGRLDDRVPGGVEWVRLGNSAAIREAMLGGRLDIGFMGIPPYLLGRDRGMPWEAFVGLSRSPLGLVTLDASIRSLDDLVNAPHGARIAVPQPGSIQHILLSMALEREGYADDALDSRLVSMGHPDGMVALLSGGEVAAHFTSPPYLGLELAEPDARLVVSGDEAFGGPFTFIVGVRFTGRRRDHDTGVSDATLAIVRDALNDANADLRRLQEDLREAGELTSRSTEVLAALASYYDLPRDELAQQLAVDGLVYEQTIVGMDRFDRAMRRFGILDGP